MTVETHHPAPREFDVRPILRSGGEPFQAIMEAVNGLRPGQALRLLAPFRPQPLFKVMEGRGFSHETQEMQGGDWGSPFHAEGGGRPRRGLCRCRQSGLLARSHRKPRPDRARPPGAHGPHPRGCRAAAAGRGAVCASLPRTHLPLPGAFKAGAPVGGQFRRNTNHLPHLRPCR